MQLWSHYIKLGRILLDPIGLLASSIDPARVLVHPFACPGDLERCQVSHQHLVSVTSIIPTSHHCPFSVKSEVSTVDRALCTCV
jgi:hypothetical protein